MFHLPSTPGAVAPLSVAAAPGVDGCPGVAYTRHASAGGRLQRFLDGAASPPWASTLLPSGLTAAASTASPSQRWPRAYATSLPGAAMFCSSLPGTVGAPVCLHSAI